MSDIIFKTKGKEIFRIPFPTPGTKCPETKLEIKMTETDISKVLIEGEYATIMGIRYKRVEGPKSPVEEAYKDWCGEYPSGPPSEDARWDAFLNGYWVTQPKAVPVEEPSKPMNEVLDKLENKYKDAEENAASYMTDDVVNRMLKKWEENPPEFLKFELGKTLEQLVTDWLDDFVPTYSTWDGEVDIAVLMQRIEKWLPDFQSSSGSQSLGVEDMVEGFNDCLKKIKSKLRNKKI
jgi:hypothetical protein